MRNLPGFTPADYSPALSKATRASLLALLRDAGFSSIRQVLASVKSPANGTKISHDQPSLICGPPSNAPNLEEEWISSPDIVACATHLLGTIDLDPCGTSDPRWHLAARNTVTLAEDALRPDCPWSGRIFLHPPFSKTEPFVRRVVGAVLDGEAEEALIVLPAVTDAPCMDAIQPFSRAFLRRRPTFPTSGGDLIQPPMPYMLVYITRTLDRDDAFAYSCASIADVYSSHHL